jgi:hypothetical protein
MDYIYTHKTPSTELKQRMSKATEAEPYDLLQVLQLHMTLKQSYLCKADEAQQQHHSTHRQLPHAAAI